MTHTSKEEPAQSLYASGANEWEQETQEMIQRTAVKEPEEQDDTLHCMT